MIFCAEFLGWVVVLRAAAYVMCTVRLVPCTIRTVHTTYAAAHKTTTHPKNSAQKIICCNSTSNVPDDGRMYPKHVELRIHQ